MIVLFVSANPSLNKRWRGSEDLMLMPTVLPFCFY